MRLADRILRISSSPTTTVTTAVDRLRRTGLDVIDFGAGEPDFETPDSIKSAAHRAIDAGFTRYTPVSGTWELKRAVCQRYQSDYGVEYTDDQIVITAGGKQALFNTALALFSVGDEVVLHAPYWPSLLDQVKLAEATPVVVQMRPEDGFAIHARQLLEAVTPRTRGIIVNSPCNPTGALIAESELRLIAREAVRREFWLIIDLCYEQLIHDAVAHNLPAIVAAECPERGILCGSASKAYAMTGWRCGWAIAPLRVVAALEALQSHATSNVSSITQKAATAALTGSQDSVAEMRRAYAERRDAVCEWLAAAPYVRCHKPAGAFYVFVDVGEVLSPDGLRTSADFARALLDEEGVAVTPGEAFDAPGFVRISYATSMERLREGSGRLLAFVARHAPEAQPAR